MMLQWAPTQPSRFSRPPFNRELAASNSPSTGRLRAETGSVDSSSSSSEQVNNRTSFWVLD